MHKKYNFILALASGCLLLSATTHAYTIDDNTLIAPGHSLSWAMAPGPADVIGPASVFNASGITISASGNSLNFSLATNMPSSYSNTVGGTTYNMYRGDFFIDTNHDLTPDYGVVLSDHATRSAGTPNAASTSFGSLGPGLYQIVSLLTSTDLYEEVNSPSYNGAVPPAGGIDFGEYYYDLSTDNLNTFMGELVPTTVLDGILLSSLTINETITGGTNPNYILDFMFPANLIGGMNPFYAIWSSDSAGSDVIAGQAPVPEPATMLLMGTGLAGLFGYGRKKKAEKAA